MILVSFFSEDNDVLSDEIKICYIFEYLSNQGTKVMYYPMEYVLR